MSSGGVEVSVSGSESELDSARSQIEGLRTALETRTVIGTAIGLLMVEQNLTAQASFARLVERSSNTNTKLRDVAVAMVEEADRRAAR